MGGGVKSLLCAEVSPPLNTTWGDRSPGSQAQEWDSEKGGRFVIQVEGLDTASSDVSKRGGQMRIDAESETFVPMVFDWQSGGDVRHNVSTRHCSALQKSQTPAVVMGLSVRRLTPLECERLQGFPDGYTKINEKTKDGPRYKAIGNSMAVPVMRWLGERIEATERGAIARSLDAVADAHARAVVDALAKDGLWENATETDEVNR